MSEIFIRYKIPILIALVSELVILFFLGRLSVYLFPQSRAATLNIWELWNVWDAPHYIQIASSGYQNKGIEVNFIVFLPFLPLLIFLSKSLFHTNFLTAGYIVSFITSTLLAIMFYKLTLIDYPKRIACRTVLFLFIFPTAFFLHIPYTESLFLLLSIAAFYFVRKRNYWTSLFLVSLADFTKVAGLALVPAIFSEILFLDKKYFEKMSKDKKFYLLFFGFFVINKWIFDVLICKLLSRSYSFLFCDCPKKELVC